MTEEQIIFVVETLLDSKVFEKLPQPGSSQFDSMLFYIPLVLLIMFSLKYIVINGAVKKFFDYQKGRNEMMVRMLDELTSLNTRSKDEQKKLSDVLRLLAKNRRKSDEIEDV